MMANVTVRQRVGHENTYIKPRWITLLEGIDEDSTISRSQRLSNFGSDDRVRIIRDVTIVRLRTLNIRVWRNMFRIMNTSTLIGRRTMTLSTRVLALT